MKQHTATSEIAAAPREVFEILAQPGRLHLTYIHLLDAAVVGTQTRGLGTVYRWQLFVPVLGHVGFDEEVTAWQEERLIRTRARSTHHLETELQLAPSPTGTQLTVTVIYATPKGALLTSATDWLVRYLTGRIVEGVRVSLQRREVLASAL